MRAFKTVSDVWTVTETTRLFGLKLTESGKIVAPEGKQVTLVYNGENLPILPGQYEGNVVLEAGTVWNVTGDCYLSSLTIAEGAAVKGAVLTVDGRETALVSGTYTGALRLTV